MKICMVYNTDSFWLGPHVSEVVVNMAKLGHTVYLLIPETKQLPQSERIKTSPITPRYSFLPVVGSIIQALSAIASYRGLAKREHITTVYLRGLHFALFFSVFRKFRDFELLFEMNGIFVDELVMRKKWLKFVKPLLTRLELFAAKNSSAVIAVTPGIKSYLLKQGLPDGKVSVVENGVNIELFKPLESANRLEKIRHQLSVRTGERIVTFVGSLLPWQGVEDLITSIPLVLKAVPATKFLIIGDGPYWHKLTELVAINNLQDNVIFTGRVPYEDVPAYLNCSDLCVALKKPLPSGYSPLKLFEYMACQKAVIATRVEGLSFIKQNNTGVLVTPGSYEELSAVIIKLLHTPELSREMGENGREYVVKYCTWESVTKKIAHICEGLEEKLRVMNTGFENVGKGQP